MNALFEPSTLVVLALVLVVVLRTVRTRPAVQRAAFDRFARRVDLPVTAALRPRAEAALRDRNLAVDLGSATGVLILAAAAWVAGGVDVATIGDDASTSMWPIIVVGAAIAGAATGAAISGSRQARRRAPGQGPRLARVSAPTYGDYVAPLELWGGRLIAATPAMMVVVGLGVAAVTDALAPGELLTAPVALAAVVPLVALVAAEVTGRRLLELPRAAGTDLELAWHDAIRAQLLRDIVTAPLAIGVYGSFGALVAASGSVQDRVIANGLVGLIGLGAIAVVAVAVASTFDRPQRYFRRRLWPDAVGGDGR